MAENVVRDIGRTIYGILVISIRSEKLIQNRSACEFVIR